MSRKSANEETAEKNEVFSTVSSGEAGIRTLDAIADMPVFKFGADSPHASTPQSVTSSGLRVLPSSLPDSLEIDPDLARLIRAWPTLAEPLRLAVLALIGTSDE